MKYDNFFVNEESLEKKFRQLKNEIDYLKNRPDTKWQKLKEWIEEREKKHTLMLKASAFEDIEILNKMRELEGEDDK